MKIKKILSSALLAVMVFTLVVAAFPMTASAAYSNVNTDSYTTATADLDTKAFEAYLAKYLGYSFETAEEMLNEEFENGYLHSINSANNLYSLYINKYTGFVYYRNNVTGQILTSNPIDPNNNSSASALMSQIHISAIETSTSMRIEYDSYTWGAKLSQIDVDRISGGFRVNYTLGDTTPRFLLPGAIKADKFEDYILLPMLAKYTETLKYLIGDKTEENLDFFDNEEYNNYDDYGYVNTSSASKNPGIKNYIETMNALCRKFYNATTAEYKQLNTVSYAINVILTHYSLQNPAKYEAGSDKLEDMNESYPITKEGIAVYAYATDLQTVDKRIDSNNIKAYCTDYTFSMMYADEKECGYEHKMETKPVFRCALEYTFSDDGSLSVRLPASSITFDETIYTLNSITPLQYFGAADTNRDGYIFFPDGSGTVVEFADFRDDKQAISINATPYGHDYCYSQISGTHRQQVTMPVYGLVTEVNSNATTKLLYGKENVKTGFFAILEEGAALANLALSTGGSGNKYGTAFASYAPNPSDLVEVQTGEGFVSYTKPAESKYTGSYVTKIVMLVDEEVGNTAYGEGNFYDTDYVGMAACYRNYLKNNGTLSAIQTVSEDLPLYIEVLGAMEITAKFLSFPITKTIALTTFDDVITMYNELTECKTLAGERAAENEKLASETEDEVLKAEYEALAKEYRELESAVENISNINFRLTGFANGGMKFTYPTKLRWERACGGNSGFEKLLAESSSISETDGVNFGVFPDFDFSYINNTDMFDGIGKKDTVSKKIDNRYASKQAYDNVLQEYATVFDLVISSDALDRLYTKFNKDYGDTGATKISVSTLGSDLNSNFDVDNPINRDEARTHVSELLENINKRDGYELMTDLGNEYALEYAKHVLNATIDSSHFRYASYSVPFIGLVLHSYVNYTGTPLNYAGNIDFEILKSIENGAAPMYILCYQNSAFLKEDEELNEYYGVSYENWYAEMLLTYTELNAAIGDLQDFELIDHEVLIAERVIEDEEMAANYVTLQNEIVSLLDAQILDLVDESFAELALGGAANYDKRLKLTVDRDALMLQFSEILNLPVADISTGKFADDIDAVIAKYTAEYPGAANAEDNYEVSFDALEYNSKYSYITDSATFDEDYVRTEYTIDNGNVVMVTYAKGEEMYTFFLNYNSYTVNIRLDADTVIELKRFSYKREEGGVTK